MGESHKSMNTIVATRDVVFEGAPFEGSHNEEVHYMEIKWQVLNQLFQATGESRFQ